MIVEKPSGSKAPQNNLVLGISPSTAPSPPRPADQPSSKTLPAEPRLVVLAPGTQTIECLCGERLFVRSQASGTVINCTGCSRKIRIETKEGSSANRIPAVSVPPGGRTPTPTPSGYGKAELSCECGQALELVKALESQGTVCSACGRTITMEKIRAPQSKNTVIRPRFGPKSLPPTPPPPKSEPNELFDLAVAEFTPVDPAPHNPIVSSYQEVFCPCGEALTVGSEDVGKNIQCPTCLTLMAVDQLRDPKTGNSVIRVRGIGKMDQDTWSLSEFS
jgi:DNA-directed RNA polymerase subunit M/transcription elongation factor TFIIS